MARRTFDIRASKASFVTDFFSRTGDEVQQGQKLAQLDASPEEREILHLQTLQQSNQSKYMLVAPALVASRLSLLEEILKQRIEITRRDAVEYDTALEGFRDKVTPAWPGELLTTLNASRLDRLRAEVEVKQLTYSASAARFHLREIQRFIEEELRVVADRIRRLTFTSPVDGRVDFLVGIGTSVYRGQVIAVVERK